MTLPTLGNKLLFMVLINSYQDFYIIMLLISGIIVLEILRYTVVFNDNYFNTFIKKEITKIGKKSFLF